MSLNQYLKIALMGGCLLAARIDAAGSAGLPATGEPDRGPPGEHDPGAPGPCRAEFRGPAGGPPDAPFMGPGPGRNHEPPPDSFDDRPPPYLMGLRLSDDQQDKIFAILHAAAPALRDQAKAARQAQEALRDAGRSTQFDVNAITALVQSQAAAMSRLTLLRLRSEHDVYLVLTPEQRSQLADRDRKRDHGSWGHEGLPPG
jgi:Spy/CpxP family protein refolding chaperone